MTDSIPKAAVRWPNVMEQRSARPVGEWLLLDLVEKDGPPVSGRGSAGFGSKLARALFVADGGGVSLDFPSSGVRCSVRSTLIRLVIVDSPSLSR